MNKLFTIMLLIMPWVFIPVGSIDDQFRLPQECFMGLCFLGMIAWSFQRGNNYIYRNKYLSIFLTYIFANFAFHFLIPFSLSYKGYGRALNTGGLEPFIYCILGFWVIQIILSNFERNDFVRIAKALCLSSFLMSVFAILQYIGLDPLRALNAKYVCQNVVSACLDNPNLVGHYLVLCFPLFFMFSNWKYGVGAIFVMSGIYVSHSHFSIFLLFLSIIVYFSIKYWKSIYTKLALILCSMGGILCILKFDFMKLSGGMSGRIPIWKIAFEKFTKNPLFGHGIGVWRSFDIMTEEGKTHWTFAHNDWLERLVELGIIGIVLMAIVVINSLKNFSYESDKLGYLCMFIIFLVMMCASFPMEVATIAVLGLVSFCAVEKL